MAATFRQDRQNPPRYLASRSILELGFRGLVALDGQQMAFASGSRMSLRAADKDRQSYELNIFHDVAKALTSSLDLDTVLQTIMEKMAAYFERSEERRVGKECRS